MLTKKQKQSRLRWAKEYRNWSKDQWDAVQWSDEARFEVCVGDTRSRVIKKKEEAYEDDCLKKKVKFPASVMVWGSMSARGVEKLHFVEGIMNASKYIDTLETYFKPTIEHFENIGVQYISQQDGAACHTAKKVMKCFVWSEINGGLESDVFASIMVRFLLSEIQKHKPSKIIVWSDGCTYQNRNVKLSNGLLELAMEQNIIIEQKYLEVGHTQMEADSIHSTIERKLKRNQEICVPADYIRIMKSAREKPSQYNVIPLTHNDFYKYDVGLYPSIRPGNKTGDPCVTDICELQYLPEGTIQYKLKFKDMWTVLPRRPSRKSRDVQHPPLYNSPCAIELTKFLHLQELKLLMPADYHSFYNNMSHKGCESPQECPHLRLVLNANQKY